MRMAVAITLALVMSGAGSAQSPRRERQELYASAVTLPDGVVEIVTTTSRKIRIPRQKETNREDWRHVATQPPVISPERNAVAAVALFTENPRADPMPLALLVYANGKLHRFDARIGRISGLAVRCDGHPCGAAPIHISFRDVRQLRSSRHRD